MSAIPLKDLLSEALQRAGISREVTTAQVIQSVNDYLKTILPANHLFDAQAIALKQGKLIIACQTGAASHLIKQKEEEIKRALVGKFPSVRIKEIISKVSTEWDRI